MRLSFSLELMCFASNVVHVIILHCIKLPRFELVNQSLIKLICDRTRLDIATSVVVAQ